MLLMQQDADVDGLLQRLANAGEPDVRDKVPASHAAALLRQYATVQPHVAASKLLPYMFRPSDIVGVLGRCFHWSHLVRSRFTCTVYSVPDMQRCW